ncbi:MAG: NYN domain-containing protein [Planctomycetes bacterium]|nr:NYN domain-containing protein [Planctomycetota bacterium]
MNTSDFGANVFDENQRRLAAGDAEPAPSDRRPRKRGARRKKTDAEEPAALDSGSPGPAPVDARIDAVPELAPPAFADEAPPPPPFAARFDEPPIAEIGPARDDVAEAPPDDRGPSRRRRRRFEREVDAPPADAIATPRQDEAPVETARDREDAPSPPATTEAREPEPRPESPGDAHGSEDPARRRRRRRRRGRRGDREFVARDDAPGDLAPRDDAPRDDAPRERSEDGDDDDARDEREPAARDGEDGDGTDSDSGVEVDAEADVVESADRDGPARAPDFRARRDFDRERHPRDRREFREREPHRQAPPQQPRIARAPVHVPTPEGETRGARIAILIDLSHIQSEAGRLDREIAWGRLVLGLGRGRHLVRSIAYATDDRAARVRSTLFGSGIDVQVVDHERVVPVAMAVDAMALASRVDAVVLVPASDDLRPMARALAGQGVRVESADFTAVEPGAAAVAQAHHRLGAECLFAP